VLLASFSPSSLPALPLRMDGWLRFRSSVHTNSGGGDDWLLLCNQRTTGGGENKDVRCATKQYRFTETSPKHQQEN
jgi:hypothetical protein